jgi:hypothetical protein
MVIFVVKDSQERTGFAYLNGELVDLAGFFAPPEFYDKWLDGELDLSEPADLASEGLGATGARGIDQQCGTGDVMPGWVREAFMERVFGTSDASSIPTVRPDTQQ